MKQTTLTVLMGTFVGCVLAFPTAAAENSAPKPRWKVAGQLEEACSCNGPCPCWFKDRPSQMTCDGMQALFITKGKYGKTPLNGLALAGFVQSPEDKSMFESFGNWKFENIYIDEKANEDQRRALEELSAHLFPAGAKRREFHFVPITRTMEGPEHIIRIGNEGYCSGHLLQGGFAGAPRISNVPLADPIHKEFQQGETTKYTYTGAGQNWNYRNSNYMFGNFDVGNKEYEKYEAEMARKMANAGPPK